MSVINEFLVEGGIYYHDFSLNNDSNLLCDFDGNPLILYTRGGVAEDVRGIDKAFLKQTMKKAGVIIGRFRINERHHWIFESEDGKVIEGENANGGNSLLNTEVLVSKAIIPVWFPLDSPKGELASDNDSPFYS